MTFSVNGNDLSQALEIAAYVGSIITMLIAALLVYLIVRPPRHVRMARKYGVVKAEPDPVEAEELWHLVERMEARLDVLERAMADQIDHEQRPALRAARHEDIEETFEPADQGRDTGRN
jgi:hypothetical protein